MCFGEGSGEIAVGKRGARRNQNAPLILPGSIPGRSELIGWMAGMATLILLLAAKRWFEAPLIHWGEGPE